MSYSDMYTLELGVFMYRFSIDDLPVASGGGGHSHDEPAACACQ